MKSNNQYIAQLIEAITLIRKGRRNLGLEIIEKVIKEMKEE